MKRDFLKSLGLEDEAIDKIIAENGKDIEATKSKADKSQEIEKLKSELESKEQLINDANAQIEKFKGMDIDGITKQAEEWKNKYSEFEATAKQKEEEFAKQLENQKYDFAVKEFLSKHEFTNDFVKGAFEESFKKQGFKLNEDGSLLGANDYIKDFQEKNQGIFKVAETPVNTTPQFVAPTNNNGGQASSDTGIKFNFTPVRAVPK
jgi:hypothetical protein